MQEKEELTQQAIPQNTLSKQFTNTDIVSQQKKSGRGTLKQAAVGFEPTNNGFANRRLSPLGHAAKIDHLQILEKEKRDPA